MIAMSNVATNRDAAGTRRYMIRDCQSVIRRLRRQWKLSSKTDNGAPWCWERLSRLFLPLVLVTLLCGCNEDDERRRTVAADRAAEWSRITDPAHGADHLRSRILQNLKVGGPYIAIRTQGSDVQVIPASTPWTVRCDDIAGLSIAFTSNVTDASGGLVVQFSEARLNAEQCLEIALPIAKVLDAILAGR